MRINNPRKAVVPAAIALSILVLRDQHATVRRKRVITDSLHDLEGIEIEDWFSRRQRIGSWIIGRRFVLRGGAVESYGDSGLRLRRGLCPASSNVNYRQPRLRQLTS